MIYEFNGEVITEEVLKQKISDEVDKASFDSYALASYILDHDENANTFDEFDFNNIDRFDDWANEIIEEEIFNDFEPADFNKLGYNSEEELEENLKNSTDWKMNWGYVLDRLT